jgi:hypothetical protein
VTHRQLIEALYTEHAPKTVEELCTLTGVKHIFNKTEGQYKNNYPETDGNYLVYHLVYGLCVYGFTVKDKWGDDDLHFDPRRGTWHHKVAMWTTLDFLEDYENTTRNV